MSGTYFNPIKRIFLNLSGGTVTGDTVFTEGVYADSLSGGTIYSGSTDLDTIRGISNELTNGTFLPISGGTGGPYLFTGDTTIFTGLVSATGFTDSSLTSGRVIYAGALGRFTSEALFEYDEVENLLKTQNIQIGNPGDTGTTTTIFGDVLVIGESISGYTSELYIEDNLIELNFNPTASTISTSLGAGFSIQDGSGVGGTDVFWDIRGAATGIANRSFSTNIANIILSESGTTSSPSGVYVIKVGDTIDGGFF